MTGSDRDPGEWPNLATVIMYESSPVTLETDRFMAAVRAAAGPDRLATLDQRQVDDSERMLLRTAHVPETVYAFSYRQPLPVNAPAGPCVTPEVAERIKSHIDGMILEIFSSDEHWATAAVTRLAGELAGDHTTWLWNYNRGRLLELTGDLRPMLRSDDAARVWETAIEAPAYEGDVIS